MAHAIRRLMDALYALCAAIAGTALVLISAIMPWAVYTRYVLNRAASWPEPTAVLLMIVLTFFGAAVCYRAGLHMRMSFFVSAVAAAPAARDRARRRVADGLDRAVHDQLGRPAGGSDLAKLHRGFSIALGRVTYLPIPLGGAVLLLFVIERVTIGAPAEAGRVDIAAFD